MKILYGIQATGNGHMSRANDIVPILQKRGSLDIVVSGIQADVSTPFEIKYKLEGLSFIFGKSGGVDIWSTYKKMNSRQLLKDIRNLPVEEYDLIINDFEPVSAWAARLKKIPCIALSHQAAVLNRFAPKPKQSGWFGKFILKYYAPAKYKYGFHFKEYDKNIYTPVIRQQVRSQIITNKKHYTVYLPAYGDKEIISILSKFTDVEWEVFSKHTDKTYQVDNIFITPVDNLGFIKSMASSEGVLCGAGFEIPAETLFLKKKLLVIPMKGQYEQQSNAAALDKMRVPVIRDLKEKYLHKIDTWLKSVNHISVNYPNNTENIIDKILDMHLFQNQSFNFCTQVS